jgi:hypothetical protein
MSVPPLWLVSRLPNPDVTHGFVVPDQAAGLDHPAATGALLRALKPSGERQGILVVAPWSNWSTSHGFCRGADRQRCGNVICSLVGI